MTEKEKTVLEAIIAMPGEDPGWVAMCTNLSTCGLGRVAHNLMRKGLVYYDYDWHDNRKKTWWPTNEAYKLKGSNV